MKWIEWIGYLGAALVVVSFLAGKNMRLLRTVNMLGALTFIIYGVLLDFNLPIIIPNAFITCIQVYYLFIKPVTRQKKTDEQ
jgi:hypothetical protein